MASGNRQVDASDPAEFGRGGTERQHIGVGDDLALIGHDPRRTVALCLDALHGRAEAHIGAALGQKLPQPAHEGVAVAGLVLRREERAGEPVARIIGTKEFWGLEFHLADATLVPRPDTEILVETALAWIDRQGRRDEPLRIVDIGTGSGAILIALLSALPNAIGLGIDLSEEAARAARG